MSTKIAIPTLFAILFLSILGGCGSKSPDEHIADARRYIEKRDYAAATLELKSALQSRSDDAEARLLLGRALYRTRDYAAAEKELLKARQLGAPADETLPTLALLFMDMGEYRRVVDEIIPTPTLSPAALAAVYAIKSNALLNLNRREEALRTLAEAARVDPKHPEVVYARARLALIDGRLDEARSYAQAALQGDAAMNRARYVIAAVLIGEGREDDALAVYQQILASDPWDVNALVASVNHFIQKNEFAKAEKLINSARKLAPQLPIINYAQALLEFRRGQYARAEELLHGVLKAVPEHLPTHMLMTTVSLATGKYAQARKSAERIHARRPNDSVAIKLLATAQIRTGDGAAALATLKPALRANPSDAGLLSLAGEAHLMLGQHDEAIGHLQRAVEAAPQQPDLKIKLGRVYAYLGDEARALDLLEDAAPSSPQARIDQAVIHLRRGAHDAALKTLTDLLAKDPENPVLHNLRAMALLGRGDRTGARRDLEQALSAKPDFVPAIISLARLDQEEGQIAQARQRLEAVLRKDENNTVVMLALANLAAAQRNERDYVQLLQAAAKADAKAIPPRAALARYHLAKGETERAMDYAHEALNANPGNADALALMGAAQLAANDHAGALATYGKLAEQWPNSPEVWLRQALAQISAKQPDKARVSLERALKLRPGDLPALATLWRLEMAEKRFDAALAVARRLPTQNAALGQLWEAETHMAQARYGQAAQAYERARNHGAGTRGLIGQHRALVMAGRAPEANRLLSDWLQRNPEDVAAIQYAAEHHAVNRRYAEAIRLLEAVVRRNPDNAIALNDLANLYLWQRDPRAQATAEQALKLDPNNPLILDTLGWILVQNGQAAQGLTHLRAALARLPDHPSLRYHLAVAQSQLGERAAAKQELQRLLAAQTSFPEVEQARQLLRSLGGS